ncbi:MAG TPA: large conductance mechanosensitive channel protein MscL [Terracidiphilus sp.]|nr:large conductance mechanosensitive channel protein MscL [Terracidiphilus sp.]
MLKGFRDFILRGNVVDMAVGVIIGAAFNAVVSSLVKDIFNPLIASTVGKPDFGGFAFTFHGGKFAVGDVLDAVISFLIVATVVYFGVVMPMQWLLARVQAKKEPPPPNTRNCPECLSEIPNAAKRCAHCGQAVEPVQPAPATA